MNSFVTSLNVDPPLPAHSVGGKAAALSRLLRAGFPVPPGLCLTTAAFHLAISPYQVAINELVQGYDLHNLEAATAISAQINTILAGWSLPAEVSYELFEALPRIAAKETIVAVRSSAIHEDNSTTSFAGQYATLLGGSQLLALFPACFLCLPCRFSWPCCRRVTRSGDMGTERRVMLINVVLFSRNQHRFFYARAIGAGS
jgi:pyruvate,water dikinase